MVMQYIESVDGKSRTVVGHLSSKIEEVPSPFYPERWFRVTDVYGEFDVMPASEVKVGTLG